VFSKILIGVREDGSDPEALALGRRLAQATGAEAEAATAASGAELGELARSRGADLVVLGPTHREGFARLFPGTTVDRLSKHPPCALAIAPRGFGTPKGDELDWRPLEGDEEDAGLRVLGVGFDGSPSARAALDVAAELALANGATIRVFAVAHKLGPMAADSVSASASPAEAELEARRAALHTAVAALPDETRALPVLLRGYAAAELVGAVKSGVDLLVLGSRGGGPVWRAFHGSVSAAVIDASPCPILIVPLGLSKARPQPS
jgi:nucleotide-binding universal stress UspA family protein